MTGIRYAQGYYFAKPMFFEEFSPLKRVASESRLATGFRDLPEKRRMHSRSR